MLLAESIMVVLILILWLLMCPHVLILALLCCRICRMASSTVLVALPLRCHLACGVGVGVGTTEDDASTLSPQAEAN